MELKTMLGLVLLAMALTVSGADKMLEGEDTVCTIRGNSGKMMCQKMLQGDCDMDQSMDSDEDSDESMDSDEDTTHMMGSDESTDSDEDTTHMMDDDDSAESSEGRSSPESDGSGEKCKKTEVIEMWIVSITERGNNSSANNEITIEGEDFTFGQENDDTTIPDSNVKGNGIQLSAILSNRASLVIDVYIVESSGEVTLDDEVADVEPGQMKFTITITDWAWMYNDTDSLEVVMQLKGRGTPKPKNAGGNRRRPKMIELEGNAEIVLSRKVKSGGDWKDMEEGYPKSETKQNKNMITVRLPKPEGDDNTIMYDPVAEMGDWPEDEDGPIGAATMSSLSIFCVTSLLAAILVL